MVLCGVGLEEFESLPIEDFTVHTAKSFSNTGSIYIHKDFNRNHYPLFIFDIECYFSYMNVNKTF